VKDIKTPARKLRLCGSIYCLSLLLSVCFASVIRNARRGLRLAGLAQAAYCMNEAKPSSPTPLSRKESQRKLIQSGHTERSHARRIQNGSEHVFSFSEWLLLWREKRKKMMASRKLWCAWRQLGQIVLRRAFAQPDAHAKQITARRAGSCIAFKSHGGKRVSRLHVYRVVIRQDRLFSFLNNWMQLLTSSTQGSPGRQCRSSPRSS